MCIRDRSIDHKDRDLGTFESLYLECYSTMKNTGSQPCHSSLQLGNANYTGLKLSLIHISKLCAMTDEDFAQLELYPDFDQ